MTYKAGLRGCPHFPDRILPSSCDKEYKPGKRAYAEEAAAAAIAGESHCQLSPQLVDMRSKPFCALMMCRFESAFGVFKFAGFNPETDDGGLVRRMRPR